MPPRLAPLREAEEPERALDVEVVEELPHPGGADAVRELGSAGVARLGDQVEDGPARVGERPCVVRVGDRRGGPAEREVAPVRHVQVLVRADHAELERPADRERLERRADLGQALHRVVDARDGARVGRVVAGPHGHRQHVAVSRVEHDGDRAAGPPLRHQPVEGLLAVALDHDVDGKPHGLALRARLALGLVRDVRAPEPVEAHAPGPLRAREVGVERGLDADEPAEGRARVPRRRSPHHEPAPRPVRVVAPVRVLEQEAPEARRGVVEARDQPEVVHVRPDRQHGVAPVLMEVRREAGELDLAAQVDGRRPALEEVRDRRREARHVGDHPGPDAGALAARPVAGLDPHVPHGAAVREDAAVPVRDRPAERPHCEPPLLPRDEPAVVRALDRLERQEPPDEPGEQHEQRPEDEVCAQPPDGRGGPAGGADREVPRKLGHGAERGGAHRASSEGASGGASSTGAGRGRERGLGRRGPRPTARGGAAGTSPPRSPPRRGAARGPRGRAAPRGRRGGSGAPRPRGGGAR